MKVRYFIECRIDRQTLENTPMGIWLQDSTGVEIYYPDETSDEYWEANEVLNILAENQLDPPLDFLDFHFRRGGYYVNRVGVFETDLSKLSVEEFLKMTLKKVMTEEGLG